MSGYARYSPSEKSLELAIDYLKYAQSDVMSIVRVAAIFDAYLLGELVVGIKLEELGTFPEIRTLKTNKERADFFGPEPEDSFVESPAIAGKTRENPTPCSKGEESACDDQVGGSTELAKTFIRSLPDPELEQLNFGLRTEHLADLMGKLAHAEIQRRIKSRSAS
ncbi:hypothetical protein NQF87_03410 [Bombella sp. TMW 2.2559]|uniref:Uncharacterized protein n=1 Tax=Bombella dulcis TaxID=2967339 RepID=A0ABT3WBJ0_9PROT|nr:hypothetical protein [Bombella dulcis]MCX5616023.1 hypothetical protein [Bombella dulcis]